MIQKTLRLSKCCLTAQVHHISSNMVSTTEKHHEGTIHVYLSNGLKSAISEHAASTSIACEGSVILILASAYWKSEPLNDRAPRKITSRHKLFIESIGTANLFPTRFGNLTHQTHITTKKSWDKSSKAACSRRGGDVVESYGVVLAGGDEEILLAVEVEAVYLPGLEPNSSRHHGE